MIRSWSVAAVLAALVIGVCLALVLDWPNKPGACVATWQECEP